MDSKMKFFYQQLVSAMCCIGLVSCSHNEHKGWMDLPQELAETSGLACLNEQLWTINDSGNAAVIYQLNARGDVLRRLPLTVRNVDWEAVTSFDNNLFIGDIGNNAGARHELTIHQVSSPETQSQVVKSWQIRYPDQPSGLLVAYDHDFDAEALVALNNRRLMLFTKSWHSDISHVYQIDLASTQPIVMQKRADIVGLPGIVTDAAVDPATGHYLLVGYQNYRRNLLQFAFSGEFSPFIATVDQQFNVLEVQNLPFDGQVEAVTVCSGQRWFSAEKSTKQPARLWRVPNQ